MNLLLWLLDFHDCADLVYLSCGHKGGIACLSCRRYAALPWYGRILLKDNHSSNKRFTGK
jgi:hypothetical protein